MGSRYLHDLAEICRRSGYPVIEVDGWQDRARGSGGYNDGKPDHLCVHHTASGASMDGWGDVNYMTFNHGDAPLCNLYLSRVPEIFVCAGGSTNTNGSGDCPHLSPDTMNSSAIGIEAGNNGVGEHWPEAQQDAYVALCRVLCDGYGIPLDHVHGHAEWAPSRKIDMAGNSRYASGGNTWNFDAFRIDIGEGEDDMPSAQEIADAIWATQIPNYITGGTETAAVMLAGAHYEAYAAAHPDPTKGPMVPNQIDGNSYDWVTMLSGVHYEAYHANHQDE